MRTSLITSFALNIPKNYFCIILIFRTLKNKSFFFFLSLLLITWLAFINLTMKLMQ